LSRSFFAPAFVLPRFPVLSRVRLRPYEGTVTAPETDLTELFLAHAPRELRDAADLDSQLDHELARCRAAWPGIALDARDFLPCLAARLPAELDPLAPFATVQVTDLYLACACGRGDPAAIAAFEARFLPEVDLALDHLRATRDQKQEVAQALRVQLLTGAGADGPAITGYSGRGSLAGWLRVAAVRAGCRLIQREQRAGTGQEELLAELPAGGGDSELAILKARYRREFAEAFEAAVASLETHERVLLRLHAVDGLSIDDIGALYRVHRATIARRIAKARGAIASRTRREMMRRLKIARTEQESIMRLIQSELAVSLSRCLPPVDALAADQISTSSSESQAGGSGDDAASSASPTPAAPARKLASGPQPADVEPGGDVQNEAHAGAGPRSSRVRAK
jgi:RNA polymerase sigma-70 factor (ECF subfamily)